MGLLQPALIAEGSQILVTQKIIFRIKHLSYFNISVSKFIRIGIADKNDNPPYFDKSLYEAEVDENEDIQHTVLTVTASDKDECKQNRENNSNL